MPAIDISKIKKPKAQINTSNDHGLLSFLSKDLSLTKGKLSDSKKESFYNELSMLVVSGIDLKTALQLTCASIKKTNERRLFEEIQMQVIAGKSLSQALFYSKKFSEYEYHGIRIGEETGKLGEILTELSLYFRSKIQQKRKIVGALTYPILVLSTSLAAIFFMIKFVVPMFSDVFKRFGGKLPFITSVIVSFSDWLDNYFYLVIVFVISLVIFYQLSKENIWFKKHAALLLLRVPIMGEILKKIYLARFANTMRLLTGTNTPLLQALGLVRQMISFYPINASLLLIEQDILIGTSLSTSLSKHSFYPEKFVQMIKIAEEVNKLSYFFNQLANQYTEEVTHKTNAISSILEPLIIIVLGLAVGIILIAMYLPMFQLSSNF